MTVFGRASVVSDREEAREWLQSLLDKYAPHLRPGVHYRPIIDEEQVSATVMRIDIDSWSGKRKQAAEDFPGAFVYGQLPS
ncbi:MAG: pyridoxamine 5'-phosphate oxidase family protein [Anaerolineae bacterium]|nr:pyridoxamine 5'-phosphate oxidase family protein [Anaerolineae bacterium]